MPIILSAPALRSRLALAAVWGALVLLLFSGVYPALGVGIDASWAWAINALRAGDRLPGRDVAFTLGPLGWLLHPAAVGDAAASHGGTRGAALVLT